MNTEILNKIEQTSKRLEKESLLKNIDSFTKEVLALAVDPAIVFNITADYDDLVVLRDDDYNFITRDHWWKNAVELLNKFSSRELTGNAAIAALEQMSKECRSDYDLLWYCRVINKDLRCGVSVKTLNNVFPGTVEPFEVALAKEFDPEEFDASNDGWFVEPKLDGLRMVVFPHGAYTRNGKKLVSVEAIEKSLQEIRKYHREQWVFDGEVMGGGDDFDLASGAVRAHEQNDNAVYHIFDIMPLSHWQKRETDPLVERKLDLKTIEDALKELDIKNVKVVEWKTVESSETSARVFDLQSYFESKKYEGAMVKKNAPYTWGRSNTIQKVKSFVDVDVPIVGVLEGRGRLKGKLGALVVELDGITSKVGSGFSDEQRKILWENRDGLDGLTVCVKYQNLSRNGSMRFPVFIRMRGDKD